MPPLVAIDVRDAYGPQPRGWGRYAGCLYDALRELGDGAGFALEPLTDGGWGPEVLFEQVKLPLRLRRRRAALVHATNCFLPLVRPCPGVVTINDLAFETWPGDFALLTREKYRALARLAARSAERIICPSAYTRDDVCRRYRIAPDKVRVIPDAPALPLGPGPAGSEEATGGPSSGSPYVLAVGDLRQKKNLGALVRAFSVVRRRRPDLPHRLVLAGVDSGEGPRLAALSREVPIELPGYVSDERLDALIRGADLLVHPSLYEGFGLVVLEAMVRDTPVLAARATALPETGGPAAAYFEPGRGGPEAVDDLARVLEDLLTDSGARADLVRRGREWAAGFSWERTARETADVYRELL